MKKNLKQFILAAAFLFLLVSLAQAETRVATVNLQKLFNQYWKTGLIQAALKTKAREFNQTDHQMIADLQKAQAEYQKLLGESNNQALSPAENASRQRAAENQLEHVRELEDNIRMFEEQASATLADQESRARKDILAEISTAVASVARAKGYSLVVDANIQGADADPGDSVLPPVVIYSNAENDLTQSVLSQLNAGAPMNISTNDNVAIPGFEGSGP
jgi:outer membrane protein